MCNIQHCSVLQVCNFTLRLFTHILRASPHMFPHHIYVIQLLYGYNVVMLMESLHMTACVSLDLISGKLHIKWHPIPYARPRFWQTKRSHYISTSNSKSYVTLSYVSKQPYVFVAMTTAKLVKYHKSILLLALGYTVEVVSGWQGGVFFSHPIRCSSFSHGLSSVPLYVMWF